MSHKATKTFAHLSVFNYLVQDHAVGDDQDGAREGEADGEEELLGRRSVVVLDDGAAARLAVDPVAAPQAGQRRHQQQERDDPWVGRMGSLSHFHNISYILRLFL